MKLSQSLDQEQMAPSFLPRTGGAGAAASRGCALAVRMSGLQEARGVGEKLTSIAVARECSTCARLSKGRSGSILIARRSCLRARVRSVVVGGDATVRT